MKLSIFTPSHDPKYLQDAYNSIKDQPFDEWVILHNGPEHVRINFNDTRVIQYNKQGFLPYVGALKREVVAMCTGDIFLELDHDDMLLPGAVQAVKDAFVDHEVGFVYSNAVRVTEDLRAVPRFADGIGWEYRKYDLCLEELVSFPPHPMNVSRIWFAPDHLRAFHRSAYYAAGGYNRAMRVLDDLDLMCRMYSKTKFHHIDKPLYLYRLHDQNSFLIHNDEIQRNVMRIHEQYIEQMALKWANDNGLMALDLGGRINPSPGYTTVDLRDADIICDLSSWHWSQFQDGSVGVIRAHDVLEHLPNSLHLMEEIQRVLAPDGMLLIQVPSTDGRGAFQDPTHINFYNENSFLYYTDKRWAKYIDTPVRFQAVMCYTTPKDEMGVCWTRAHLRKISDDIRIPGPILI